MKTLDEKLKVGKELDESFASVMRLMLDGGVTNEKLKAANERYGKARANLHRVLYSQKAE